MEDNKTKQGESTPEDYIKSRYHLVKDPETVKTIALNAVGMARKSEREKVIREIEGAVDIINSLILDEIVKGGSSKVEVELRKAKSILTNNRIK
jgi:hypothetical protein